MPPLVFPQESTADALRSKVAQTLTLRMYSNNRTPQVTDTISSYVEVTGGGYAAVPLNSASWAIVQGSPSVATYNNFIDFVFTAVPANPNVYGYYITNSDDELLLAEEFNPSDIPFVITAPGQTIQIRPRFGADNLIAPPVEIT
jgi:hypothetical protein